ncbi:hypothetical protein MM2B0307_2061 [Mycobacteroides abscessus subsp. bolletii 2B-0307]|nr:hypothetical protein MM2B0307_2061 [Mycobacteroides abscessus subsp. bolletii 2B-0307]
MHPARGDEQPAACAVRRVGMKCLVIDLTQTVKVWIAVSNRAECNAYTQSHHTDGPLADSPHGDILVS